MSDGKPFDLEKTKALIELFQTPREGRDQAWVGKFLEAVPQAPLKAVDQQVRRGPDGFPYLFLSLPSPGEKFQAFSVDSAVESCLKNGCGIVLFSAPDKLDRPEWLFTFGSLSSYEQYGNFLGDPSDEPGEAATVMAEQHQVVVSAPSEEFLPAFARVAIGNFLRETLGLESPRIALVLDPTMKPSRSLMFADLMAEHFEKPEHFHHCMRALTWFLPPTRGLMAGVPELSQHALPLV